MMGIQFLILIIFHMITHLVVTAFLKNRFQMMMMMKQTIFWAMVMTMMMMIWLNMLFRI